MRVALGADARSVWWAVTVLPAILVGTVRGNLFAHSFRSQSEQFIAEKGSCVRRTCHATTYTRASQEVA